MIARATMPQVDDDEPVTLKEACELYRGRFKVATLRAEASRDRLDIFRIGRTDYTTPKSMREMVRKCQDAARRHGSTSTPNEDSGLSEMEQLSAAQAALNQTVAALKSGSPLTSGSSTPHSRARRRP